VVHAGHDGPALRRWDSGRAREQAGRRAGLVVTEISHVTDIHSHRDFISGPRSCCAVPCAVPSREVEIVVGRLEPA
jgi:hypothetical protein